jgi:hypothetical protein
MAFKDDSKQYFQTGDYPTEAQFALVFDLLRWKDEPISINIITGLLDLLNAVKTLDQVTAAGAIANRKITVQNINLTQVPVYENNATAIANGLVTGDIYRLPYNNGIHGIAIVIDNIIPAGALLNEDGTPILNEDGSYLIIE